MADIVEIIAGKVVSIPVTAKPRIAAKLRALQQIISKLLPAKSAGL